MENFGLNNSSGNNTNAPNPPDDKPIPFDFEDGKPKQGVSSSPLNLGTSKSATSAPPISAPPQPLGFKKAGEKLVSSDRVTGSKTFFAKLHAGSIEYIDDAVTSWLKENPGVVIKYTNTVTGMLVSKTTEPHIIVTVWY